MFGRALAALCAAGVVACAGPACAVVMVSTYTGATNGFTDTAGTFGGFTDNGSGLNAGGWRAVFTFDPTVGHQNNGFQETSTGGLTATFTLLVGLSEYTVDIAGSGTATRSFNFQPFEAFENRQSDGATSLRISLGLPAGQAVPELDDPVPFMFLLSGVGSSGTLQGDGFSGSLIAETIEVHPFEATLVPEPSSWALMIAGFGAVGAVLRRSRCRDMAAPAA
jgi:hypothetical protein